jgi:hypothetical protein
MADSKVRPIWAKAKRRPAAHRRRVVGSHNRRRKVHVGPRGGRYVIRKGRKVYKYRERERERERERSQTL